MPLRITVGALEDEVFSGNLEYISPKGVLTDGAVQFEVRAALETPSERFIRAGVSATADIVLESRESVLSINESLLQFSEEGVTVDVEVGEQVFEARAVELGLSDGIYTEVLSGITAEDGLKGRMN
jgi:HlyD family secretion protein